MHKFITFLDRQYKHHPNVHIPKSNTEIQCDPNQTPNNIFLRRGKTYTKLIGNECVIVPVCKREKQGHAIEGPSSPCLAVVALQLATQWRHSRIKQHSNVHVMAIPVCFCFQTLKSDLKEVVCGQVYVWEIPQGIGSVLQCHIQPSGSLPFWNQFALPLCFSYEEVTK